MVAALLQQLNPLEALCYGTVRMLPLGGLAAAASAREGLPPTPIPPSLLAPCVQAAAKLAVESFSNVPESLDFSRLRRGAAAALATARHSWVVVS